MSFELFRSIAVGAFLVNLAISIYEVFRGWHWVLIVTALNSKTARQVWIALIAVFFVVAVASPLMGEPGNTLDWAVAALILAVSVVSIVNRFRRMRAGPA